MKSIYFLFFILISSTLWSQDFNRIDESGLKQGPWKKYFEGTKSLFYEGQFKNDKPTGVFTYYYRSGKTKGIMKYEDRGSVSRSSTYHENGKLMAAGKYVEQKKDSTWNYFTKRGLLSSIERYDRGAKHGREEVFYSDGKLMEETLHSEGLRDGPWVQYHPNGKIKVQGNFVQDQLEGEMLFFYENGRQEIKGRYQNGLREGNWIYFHDDGSIHFQAVYRQGDLVKEKKENGVFYVYGKENVVIAETTYKNGMKHGPCKTYHDDVSFKLEEISDPLTGERYMKEVKYGNGVKMEGNYKEDQLIGVVRHFDSAGNLIKEENYIDGRPQ